MSAGTVVGVATPKRVGGWRPVAKRPPLELTVDARRKVEVGRRSRHRDRQPLLVAAFAAAARAQLTRAGLSVRAWPSGQQAGSG